MSIAEKQFPPRIGGFAGGFFIFSYGLFTIAAQTLLFREFITAFEGNDIGVGIFFACWFLWVALGAILVYKIPFIAEILTRSIELLLLAYIPAFLLEMVLIVQGRSLFGVESYTLMSIGTLLVLSIIVTAPVSIITGMLFPSACKWFQENQKFPVSHVYILEAAGSFIGGVSATILLACGFSPAKIFLLLSLIVASAVCVIGFVKLAQRQEYKNGWANKYNSAKVLFGLLILSCTAICLGLDLDNNLANQIRTLKWRRLMPVESLKGSFQTAQAEYLYGIYKGQWLVAREGGIVEALPDETSAGQTAAIGLCQKNNTKKVLVVGSGLGLCKQYLKLPQIENVTWAYCDTEYIQKIENLIPDEFKVKDSRLKYLTSDIRSFLTSSKNTFDLVVLNLPDATSSAINRYYTIEFYQQIKDVLRKGGVCQIRVRGGENIMGTELINLGASVKSTLGKVFPKIVLTPGEETWFIASNSNHITDKPAVLVKRFAKIKNADKIFNPPALLSIYLPDRASAAMKSYSNADLPESLLINRDSRPLTNLYSLLLTAKQSDAPVTKLAKYFAVTGPIIFIVPILVYIVLRLFYLSKVPNTGKPSTFDGSFLVFSTGWIGIGVVIVLMYLYQIHFGSLYLHIGIISSLFMVGLTAGAAATNYLLKKSNKVLANNILLTVIFIHSLVLYAIAFWPSDFWTHISFALAFVLCGLCTGCYFPLAAYQLATAGLDAGKSGGKLETADHIGASLGGLLTGLAFVPILGTKITLFVFILFIAANLLPAIWSLRSKITLSIAGTNQQRLAYTLLGVGISVIICSNLLTDAKSRLRPAIPLNIAQGLAGQSTIEQTNATIGNEQEINYFKVYDNEKKLTGYIFSSDDLASQIQGFGGKIDIAIFVDTSGKLIDFNIINSSETPSYLKMLTQWFERLKNHNLFSHRPFNDVDAVTGATVSSKAILSSLEISGQKFTSQILNTPVETVAQEKSSRYDLFDTTAIYLVGAFVLSIIAIYHGRLWSRLAVLFLNFIIGGVILNAQYSTEQMISLLSWHIPSVKLSAAFLLIAIVPLLVIILGNVYCGYMCPFGALQELVGFILPKSLKGQLPADNMRKAWWGKYLVLFVIILAFFFSGNHDTLSADPLITAFSASIGLAGKWIGIAAVIMSVFYSRFWCRYLCPAGAFLSLVNYLTVLKRLLPAKIFARCEYGVTANHRMECIYCDRCRYKELAFLKDHAQPEPIAASMLKQHFLKVAVVAVLVISVLSANRFFNTVPKSFIKQVSASSSSGQPRNVDESQIRTMIQQKRLSDHNARYYKTVE